MIRIAQKIGLFLPQCQDLFNDRLIVGNPFRSHCDILPVQLFPQCPVLGMTCNWQEGRDVLQVTESLTRIQRE